VSEDLKRIQKGKALAPVLLVRDDVATGLPLIVADGYHRICAVCYFDESAPIPCRIADVVTLRNADDHVAVALSRAAHRREPVDHAVRQGNVEAARAVLAHKFRRDRQTCQKRGKRLQDKRAR
jgi:hypothetical protein